MHAPLTADHDAGRLPEVELPGGQVAADVEGHAPEPGTLDLRDGAGQPADPDQAQVLAGSAAGLDHRARHRRRAALGNDHAVDAGGVGAAEDGAQVLGVLDSVQRQDQARVRGQQPLQGAELARRQLGCHALVIAMSEGVDPLSGNRVDAGQAGELDQPRVGLQALGDEHALDAAGAGSLQDRVAPVDHVDPRPLGVPGALRLRAARPLGSRAARTLGPWERRPPARPLRPCASGRRSWSPRGGCPAFGAPPGSRPPARSPARRGPPPSRR